MNYCFKADRMVYSCDHSECNNTGKVFGTRINGMMWCNVAKKHVYSCDHSECNKSK